MEEKYAALVEVVAEQVRANCCAVMDVRYLGRAVLGDRDGEHIDSEMIRLAVLDLPEVEVGDLVRL
ncbi:MULTISPECIES: hypothetical protein [unclassified Rathayibacter]|uniref:hypothetical protein n=1 Tax=unclassified Rathayibacter TaxID=2609250 RepID=UPI0011B0BA2B|nr:MULTISPECIES: hypothetical protein [unclassified Rathayibacter]